MMTSDYHKKKKLTAQNNTLGHFKNQCLLKIANFREAPYKVILSILSFF